MMPGLKSEAMSLALSGVLETNPFRTIKAAQNVLRFNKIPIVLFKIIVLFQLRCTLNLSANFGKTKHFNGFDQ